MQFHIGTRHFFEIEENFENEQFLFVDHIILHGMQKEREYVHSSSILIWHFLGTQSYIAHKLGV